MVKLWEHAVDKASRHHPDVVSHHPVPKVEVRVEPASVRWGSGLVRGRLEQRLEEVSVVV